MAVSPFYMSGEMHMLMNMKSCADFNFNCCKHTAQFPVTVTE